MTCPACGHPVEEPTRRAFRCPACAALVDGLGRVRVQVHDDGWTVAADRLDPPVIAGLFTGLVAIPLFLAALWGVGSLLDLVTTGTPARSPWLLVGLPGLVVMALVWMWGRRLEQVRVRLNDQGFTVDEARRGFDGITRLERTEGWLAIPHPDGDLRVPDPDSRVYEGLVAAIRRYDAAPEAQG